ncbi:beta-2-glycoprotein 1-like [Platysternon megacephalum]|uniref:Beta-2-glycoprotein 1-like n=1 Tax=Platysternon megacephalum TaxID=55544 RepID=A0A4D9DRB8_9SAUR|nr:beta-2-glycoprotein 1-like [Platysternon megacephalum]
METEQSKPFTKHAALWSREHSQILVTLWYEVSKTVDFSKSTRNDDVYQQITKKLAALQTGDQCREHSKRLKIEYQKMRDKNHTMDNSPMICLFYEQFDHVWGTTLSTEPTVLPDDLVNWDGALLASESSMGTDGSQQQAPHEEHEVTLNETRAQQ